MTDVTTVSWSGQCKDCGRRGENGGFVYPDSWVRAMSERGGTKSDRCPACRKRHSRAVQAMAVPYLDIDVIAEVPDRTDPRGPLGGLGPLPPAHERFSSKSDLSRFDFGLRDADIRMLLRGLEDRQVAVVTAGTGSGKSTFLPYRLLIPPTDGDLHLTDIGPIVVTEPRRLAAIECATFVAKELLGSPHVGAGCDIGYRVKGAEAFDSACRLLYVTDGSLINWLRDGSYERFSTIIVDEAHERSRNIEAVLGVLKSVLPQHPRLRVIIASATIDADAFTSFFGGEEHVVRLDIQAEKEWGYGQPLWPGESIDVRHPDWTAPDGSPRLHDGRSLPHVTRQVAECRVREEALPVEQWRQKMPSEVAKQVVALLRGTDWGDVLAFLPTRPLIEECVAAIRKATTAEEVTVHELLASTPPALQELALAIPAAGEPRRVIVSTNIAETSMTIDGISFVVDSGLICQQEWTTDTASSSFPSVPHSQDGLRQRWGRVGRKAPGWVLPLYTREQFESFAEHTPPETVRGNLESYVLTAKAIGIDDPLELPSVTLHSAGAGDDQQATQADHYRREVKRAKRALAARGHIDGDGDVTHAGAELLAYSGEPGEAGAMVLADELACPIETATALVLLGGRALIGGLLRFDPRWPAAVRDAARRSHETLCDGCHDDLDVALRVWAAWEAAVDRKAFCDLHRIDGAILRSAAKRRADKLEFLSPGRRSAVDEAVRPELSGRVRVVLARAYADQTFTGADGSWHLVSGEQRLGGYLPGRGSRGGDRGRIVALGRRTTMAGADGPAYLSSIVDVEEWPLAATDVNALVRACAARLRAPDGSLITPEDPMDMQREAIPVGSRWRVSVTAGEDNDRGAIVRLDARMTDAPSPGLADEPDIEAEDGVEDFEDVDGSDDLISVHANGVETVFDEGERYVDLEELEQASAAEEAREPAPGAQPGPAEEVETVLTGRTLEPLWIGSEPAEGPAVIQVVSHHGGRVCVRRDAEHGLLASACSEGVSVGTPIEVQVDDVVVGWGRPYLVAYHVASGCPVFLDPTDLTFSKYDNTIATQVPVGSRFTVVVEEIDVESGLLRTSRLPAVARDLRRLRVGVAGGEEWHEAIIVAERWRPADVVVALVGGDAATGLVHRYGLPGWLLEKHGVATEPGTSLRVRLVLAQAGRDERRLSKRYTYVPDGLDELVANERDLTWDPASQRLGVLQPLTTGTRDRLAALSDRPIWKASMRRLWRDSNVVVARGAKPSRQPRDATADQAADEHSPTVVEVAVGDHLVEPMKRRFARDLAAQTGANVSVLEPATVRVSGADPAAVEEAAAAVRHLDALPAVEVVVPTKKLGLVIGREGVTIKSFGAIPGVRHVDTASDGRVTIIADGQAAVEQVVSGIRALVDEAEGTLELPPGKNGLLIGRQGATINDLKARSGVRSAGPIGTTSTWRVTAPSADAIHTFTALAAAHIPGTTLVAVSESGVERVRQLRPRADGDAPL
jgi:HrpA-like RNA helicase